MNRLNLLIAILFAIALGTGIVVGMGVARAPQKHDRGPWLAEELNLTPSQSEDMKNIWSDVNGPGKSTFERRHQLQKDRDDAIYALMTDEQKANYETITDKYNNEVAELNHERDQAFQAAVEATKQILNDAQRAKYDDLIKRGFRGAGRGPEGGHDGRGGPDGNWRGASTRRGGFGAGTEKAMPSPKGSPPESTAGSPSHHHGAGAP